MASECNGWILFTRSAHAYGSLEDFAVFHSLRTTIDRAVGWTVEQLRDEDGSGGGEVIGPFSEELATDDSEKEVLEGGSSGVRFQIKRVKFIDVKAGKSPLAGDDGWLLYTTEEGSEFNFLWDMLAFRSLRAAIDHGAMWCANRFEHETPAERSVTMLTILEPFGEELEENDTNKHIIEGGIDEVSFFIKRIKFEV